MSCKPGTRRSPALPPRHHQRGEPRLPMPTPPPAQTRGRMDCGTPQRPTHLDHPRRPAIHTRTGAHRRTTTTTQTPTPTRTTTATTTARLQRRTTTILRRNGGSSSDVTRLLMGATPADWEVRGCGPARNVPPSRRLDHIDDVVRAG